MAITCRNSIFWALSGLSFLGESIQSEPAGPTTCPVPHGRGCQPHWTGSSHLHQESPGNNENKSKKSADHHDDSKELYGGVGQAQTDSGLCHDTYIITCNTAACSSGMWVPFNLTLQMKQLCQRGEVIGSRSPQLKYVCHQNPHPTPNFFQLLHPQQGTSRNWTTQHHCLTQPWAKQ